MRFVCRTAGDTVVGLGHLTRTAAVASALVARGNEVEIVARVPPDLEHFVAVDGATARRVDHLAGEQEVLAQLLLHEEPTVVVTDQLGVGANDATRLRRLGAAALVHLASDGLEVVDADLAVVDDPVLVGVRHPAARMVAVGVEHHVVRPSTLAARPAGPWQGDRVRRALIALGGADPGLLTESLVRRLLQQATEFEIAAVIGAAWEVGRERAAVGGWCDRVTVHHRPTDLTEPILAADLVVTLGGRTTHEALALGRPVVCPSWSHMAPYVEALSDAGLVTDLGPSVPSAVDQLVELVRDPAPLHATARAGFAAIDGSAAERVAELCESVLA